MHSVLKLTATTANIDKFISAASKALYSIIEDGGKAGLIRIYSYPNLDSIVASTLIFKYALSSNTKVAINIVLDPPRTIEYPTILVGFEDLNYKSDNVKSKVLAFYSGELKSIPVHGATYIDGSGSLSSIVYLTITGGKSIDIDLALIALTGSYTSRFIDKVGRFHGIDRIMLDKLRLNQTLSLDMVTVVKAYKPNIKDVCTSISSTIDPYYPILTGSRDSCLSLLDSYKISDIALRQLSRLDQKSMENLAIAIIDYIKKSSNVELKPEGIIGGVLVSDNQTLPIVDFREASHTLLYIAEAVEDLGRVVATLLDLNGEYLMAESRLESYSKKISETISKLKPLKLKTNTDFKFYEVSLDKGNSPTLVWRALKLLGLVEHDSVIVYSRDETLRVSPLQVEEALGYKGCKRLVDSNIASYKGGFLLVKERVVSA